MSQISMFDGDKPLKIKKPVRLIELFAGIGSQAKALRRLGVPFTHYKICEFDKYAVQSYNSVHHTSFTTSDITQLKPEDLGIVDTDKYTYIMTYSFPCQDLSLAGNQKGMTKGTGTRSGLLWEVERLLYGLEHLPQILLMENVPQVIGEKNRDDFRSWIESLERLGYSNKYQILNAADFGIPQNRERCYMVSWLGDYSFDFPDPIPLQLRLKDMLESTVDEKYYLSDRAIQGIKNTNFNSKKNIIQNVWDKNGLYPTLKSSGSKGQDYVIDDNQFSKDQKLLDTDYGDYPMSKSPQVIGGIGTKKSNKNTQWYQQDRIYDSNRAAMAVTTKTIPYYAVKSNVDVEPISVAMRGRLNEDGKYDQKLEVQGEEYSNAITTDQKDSLIIEPQPLDITPVNKVEDNQVNFIGKNNKEVTYPMDLPNGTFRIRKLTAKECWRLMNFTDEDVDNASKVVSNSQLYKQAGNSIVVNCLVAILGQMFEGKEDEYKKEVVW